MSTHDKPEPAFPQPKIWDASRAEYINKAPGMDLRDYFAAKAMYAMCREDSMFEVLPNAEHEDNIARAAYAQADAMMKARRA